MKTLIKIAAISAVVVPLIAFAQTTNAGGFLAIVNNVLKATIPVLMVLATVVFLWGVVLYVIAGGDEEKLDRAKGFIIAGIVGLFVMIAVWGIVQAIQGTFQFNQTGIPPGPQ